MLTCLYFYISGTAYGTQSSINVDFDWFSSAATHGAADGVLSTSGTNWNHAALSPTVYSNLVTEHGISTDISLRYDPNYSMPGAFFVSGGVNTLQDGGLVPSSSFLVSFQGLGTDQLYDLAVYVSDHQSRIRVLATGGGTDYSTVSSPSATLPGVEGRDYILVEDLRPGTYGNGYIDVYVSYLYSSTKIAGIQLRPQGTLTNQAPTDLTLLPSSLSENLPAGTAVGALTTTDPNSSDTHTYTLVAGAGGDDNASFSISGSNLLTAASFNYESKSNYTVRVQTADQGGLSYEEALPLTVTDVLEPPPEFNGVAFDGTDAILQWSSIANHTYVLHDSTNLPAGFSELQPGIPATPPMNTYTDTVNGAKIKFWQVTTEE